MSSLFGVALVDDFYKEPQVFSTAPGSIKSLNSIKWLGPVGMGIDLIQPAFESIVLEDQGGTYDPTWLWSGDHVMEPNRYQALRIEPATVGGRTTFSWRPADSAPGTSRF